MSVVQMLPRTYTAKLFEAGSHKVAGTLDGFIDLAMPGCTYQLSIQEAEELATALSGAIADVKANCLYDRDPLLDTAASK